MQLPLVGCSILARSKLENSIFIVKNIIVKNIIVKNMRFHNENNLLKNWVVEKLTNFIVKNILKNAVLFCIVVYYTILYRILKRTTVFM